MSIYSNMQICGDDHKIIVHNHHNADWVDIKSGDVVITMEPKHVRAMAHALDAYEAKKKKDAKP
jgi:hypothetical protein